MRSSIKISFRRSCALFALLAAPAAAVTPQGTAASGLVATAQDAVHVVLNQVAIDPTVLTPETGKPLPVDGKWSVGTEAPSSCPRTTEACVRVLYTVPEANVSCNWVVLLLGDASSGTILEQNEDATKYLLHKIGPDQVADLVLTRKKPVYPPLAVATHVSGQVVLRVSVGPTGEVARATLAGGPPMLRASSMEAIYQWTFKPLIIGSKPVSYLATVTFDFRTFGPGSGTVTTTP